MRYDIYIYIYVVRLLKVKITHVNFGLVSQVNPLFIYASCTDDLS